MGKQYVKQVYRLFLFSGDLWPELLAIEPVKGSMRIGVKQQKEMQSDFNSETPEIYLSVNHSSIIRVLIE